MCGIFGHVDLKRVAASAPWNRGEVAAVVEARDGMAHRGPDGEGLWQAPGVLLAHRRLAILDLSPSGHQPMAGAGGAVLTFNGEIYNFMEIRAELAAQPSQAPLSSTGDTAVLLAALEHWGLAATLPRLRGMYAFGLWDPATRSLHLARDPVGKKPLYVWQRGQQLAFSSAIGPLATWLTARGESLTVDPVAVEHHLAGGYIAAPRTIWCEIQKLRAGEAWTFSPAGVHRIAPRPIPFASHPEPLRPPTLDLLDQLLQAAVHRRLHSDVPVATFLSGGLDSSLVTALAARAHPGITAYTVRTHGRNQDEFAVAQRVARMTGVEHHVLDLTPRQLDLVPELVRHYGEPFGDSSAVPTYLVSQLAGHVHRVVLTGDGGDEVQGGYDGARLFALRRLLHQNLHLPTMNAVSRRLARVLPDRLTHALNGDVVGQHGRRRDLAFKGHRLFASGATAVSAQHDRLNALHDLFDPELRPRLAREGWRALVQATFASMATTDELDRALGVDFALYLPEDLCVKVDVASMAHAVETRAPLLDLDFTDACWQVKSGDRVRPWQSKRIVRQLLARHLPADCILGRKQGFTAPVDRWLAVPTVQGELEATLRAGLPGMPFFDGPRAVAALVERRGLGEDTSVLAWRLLVLAEWARHAPSQGRAPVDVRAA